jgi:hypothetical protein
MAREMKQAVAREADVVAVDAGFIGSATASVLDPWGIP